MFGAHDIFLVGICTIRTSLFFCLFLCFYFSMTLWAHTPLTLLLVTRFLLCNHHNLFVTRITHVTLWELRWRLVFMVGFEDFRWLWLHFIAGVFLILSWIRLLIKGLAFLFWNLIIKSGTLVVQIFFMIISLMLVPNR